MKTALSDRLLGLIEESAALMGPLDEYDRLTKDETAAACVGWLNAASNLIETICSAVPSSSYTAHAKALHAATANIIVHRAVRSTVEVLKQLKRDMDAGLLTSFERQVSAETFDDLIDHAEAYLEEGRKDPAGVIAGVVFEDTLRRLCSANAIDPAGKTCEPLINSLVAAGVFSRLESKEAKAAAGLRTSAAHALWDEFNSDQVVTVIAFVRRLLRDKLAAGT